MCMISREQTVSQDLETTVNEHIKKSCATEKPPGGEDEADAGAATQDQKEQSKRPSVDETVRFASNSSLQSMSLINMSPARPSPRRSVRQMAHVRRVSNNY